LIAGITARARIKIGNSIGALVLPYEAILEDGWGGATVYKVNEDNTVSVIQVVLGIQNDLVVEVISGELEADMAVVVNPGPHLTDGVLVTLI
jgi:multidrug efflux pump subunit AcrA (membrane-fusion protein)